VAKLALFSSYATGCGKGRRLHRYPQLHAWRWIYQYRLISLQDKSITMPGFTGAGTGE
jgi:hypothetical protein